MSQVLVTQGTDEGLYVLIVRNVSVVLLFCLNFVLLFRMGDFQQLDQDFYQTGYYIDDQGQPVAYYETYNSPNPAYYNE